MLRITSLMWTVNPDKLTIEDSKLFNENPHLTIHIKAPVLWWFTLMYENEANVSVSKIFNERNAGINDIRLGDIIEGSLYITYQELVGFVQSYDLGVYEVNPANREWRDFIETIADIKGISYYAREVE